MLHLISKQKQILALTEYTTIQSQSVMEQMMQAQFEYAITVTNVNEAPTVANAISDASHAEDAAYSLDTSNVFTDVDAGDS